MPQFIERESFFVHVENMKMKNILAIIISSAILVSCAGLDTHVQNSATGTADLGTPSLTLSTLSPVVVSVMTETPTKTFAPWTSSYPQLCDYDEDEFSVSPSGNWIAEYCHDYNGQILEVENRSGQRWSFPLKNYLNEEEFNSNGYSFKGYFTIEDWLEEDGYLLFSANTDYALMIACPPTRGINRLFRLNLNTGKVSPFGWEGASSNDYAFSPDGRYLAYTADNTVLLDLISGYEYPLSTSDTRNGQFIWSPDGSEMLFTTCAENTELGLADWSTVQVFSMDTHEVKQILRVEDDSLWIFYTDTLPMLNIYTMTSFDNYYYDWSTSELVDSPNG
jgi:hypothetical protein